MGKNIVLILNVIEMINYILKKSKQLSNKYSQSYLKHFEFALVNFDKYIQEEQKKITPRR